MKIAIFMIIKTLKIMKILKKIVVVLLILIVLILVAGMFMKKDFAVTRSVEIDHSVNEVYDYAKYLKNQQEYSVWAKMDPDQKVTFTGTDGTVGFVSAWDSDNENVGQGEQEIVGMTENEKIDYVMRFKKPLESEGNATLNFKSTGEDCTHVEWSFSGDMSYPMNVMMPFIDFEGTLGPQLQKGLENMKTIIEKK